MPKCVRGLGRATRDNLLLSVFLPAYTILQIKTAPFYPKRAKKRSNFSLAQTGRILPELRKRKRLHFSYPKMPMPSQVLVSIPTYEAHFNYGNDGCDGFAPNFPLIRLRGTKLRTDSIVVPIIARFSCYVNRSTVRRCWCGSLRADRSGAGWTNRGNAG